MILQRLLAPLILAVLFALGGCETVPGKPNPAEAAKIDRAANDVLRGLYASTPSAKVLAQKAKAILVFPDVGKAGLLVGGEYGTGVLREKNKSTGYYSIVAGSIGFQAGAQVFDYVMFFMTEAGLEALRDLEGFEVGAGPTVVLMDSGMSEKLTTSTAFNDVYTYVLGQQGLMAGASLEGSKITPITP